MSLKTKTFDCVEMKREAQAQLSKKYAGLSDRERFDRVERELMTSDDPVSRWWHKLARRNKER